MRGDGVYTYYILYWFIQLNSVLYLSENNKSNIVKDIRRMTCVVTSIKEIKIIIDYNIGGVERQEAVTKYVVEVLHGAGWEASFMTDKNEYKVGEVVTLRYGTLREQRVVMNEDKYKRVGSSIKYNVGLFIIAYIIFIITLLIK